MVGNTERLTDFLTLDRRCERHFYYVKNGAEGAFIRRPDREIQGYQLLRPFFRMPNAKLIHAENGPLLIVKGISAPSADTLVETNPTVATEALQAFIEDMVLMWKATVVPMQEEKLGRNWRAETTSTLVKLLAASNLVPQLDIPLFINGMKYPTLRETLTDCLRVLEGGPEPIMVLCHGDEHLGNLVADQDGYWVIDPGNYTGYNTPSSAVNNMVGANYLFMYKYSGCTVVTPRGLEIEYQIREESQRAETSMKPLLQLLGKAADEISCYQSMSKQLLFINELRVAVGWIQRSMKLDEVLKTGMIYAGIATEHYYSSDIV